MLYNEEIRARCGWEMCEQLDHKHCIAEDIFFLSCFLHLEIYTFIFTSFLDVFVKTLLCGNDSFLWILFLAPLLKEGQPCQNGSTRPQNRIRWAHPQWNFLWMTSTASALFMTIISSLYDNKLLRLPLCRRGDHWVFYNIIESQQFFFITIGIWLLV